MKAAAQMGGGFLFLVIVVVLRYAKCLRRVAVAPSGLDRMNYPD